MPELEAPESDASTEICDWVAPENDWPIASPSCLTPEGFAPGQTPPDIRLMDQHGDEVSLWQFYGGPILLVFSAEWAAPMGPVELEDEVLEVLDAYGVSMVTVIDQDIMSEPPDQDSLMAWAQLSDDTSPVLSDDGFWANQVIPSEGGHPTYLLIDEHMEVIIDHLSPNASQIIDGIEKSL